MVKRKRAARETDVNLTSAPITYHLWIWGWHFSSLAFNFLICIVNTRIPTSLISYED